jgi:hypothetical protein
MTCDPKRREVWVIFGVSAHHEGLPIVLDIFFTVIYISL